MDEFKKIGLDVKYSKEIEDWQKYKDQEKFGKKLEKQMSDEIDRFLKERKQSTAFSSLQDGVRYKSWTPFCIVTFYYSKFTLYLQ